MPRTSCKVHMEFIDTTAVADSNISVNEMAGIGNVELLKSKDEYSAYALIDKNNFLLDGSKRGLEGDTQIPFVSEASSDHRTFENNPVITIEFSQNHTSAGITLFFVDDYPTELKVTWYDLNGTRIIVNTYYPDALNYFCKKQIENYGKLQIEFVKTRLPGQRVKLGYIQYGTSIEWTGGNIQNASLTEEVDVTSATIPINTADISILDSNNDFDLSNQSGTWKSIQKKQPLTILEKVGDKEITCGTLYLEKWKSNSNTVNFSLIDVIGLMDKTKFYNGRIYELEEAGAIIADIMESAGVEDYSVSDDVASIPLTGHIAICTHREALQQVVFACGAVADCTRTGGIRIHMPDRSADSTIGTDRKFVGTTIELDDYVSGVAITYNKYKLAIESQEIYKDNLPAGDTLLEFTEPCTDIEVSGGTLVETGTNYAVVHMDAEGECVVSGYQYEKAEVTYTANVKKLEAGEEPNVVSYSGCTLLNITRAKEVAERILNYYQLRQIVNMRYLLNEERVGEWVNIRDKNNSMAVTGITSQTIDLTGGFIATAKCRGYSKVVTNFAYTGEFYSGERGLI